MDSIEKLASLLYSVGVAILLRLKEFPKLGRSNPFFGTSPDFQSLTGAASKPPTDVQAEALVHTQPASIAGPRVWRVALVRAVSICMPCA